jgi:predicted metal-dependent peptidase
MPKPTSATKTVKNGTTAVGKANTGTVTNPVVDALVREKIVTARIGLLMRHSFFGNLATRLNIVNADSWLPTAATDGRNFFYNSEFLNKLSIRQLEFLFGHELLHVCYMHTDRRGDRDPKVYNIACDYCVNQDLVDSKVGEVITQTPILLDSKYRGKTSEEIYEILMNNAKKINMDSLFEQLIDQHLDTEDEGDGSGSGDGNENGVQKNGKPYYSAEERKQIQNEFREAMLSAAQQSKGNLPAGIKRILDSILEPKMNWKDLLATSIQSTIKSDFTWMRPSRKAWHMDCMLPGQNKEDTIDICVSIDMSGSISNKQAKDFISEVYNIMQLYTCFRCTLWTFDTEIYNPKTFTEENMDEILTYDIHGGGGTDIAKNWDFMKEQAIEPKLFVVMTDGLDNNFGDPNYCDTLWVIHSNQTWVPPHGTYAYYND